MDTNTMISKVKEINNLGDDMSRRLADYLRSVDDKTYHTFFENHSQVQLCGEIAAYLGDIRSLSEVYISRVISEVQDYKLGEMMISNTRIQPDLEEWFREKNQTVGETLAREKLRNVFPEVFADPGNHAKSLADTLCSDEFLNGMEVYCDVNPQRQQPLRLLWLLLKCLDGSQFQRVMGVWNQTSYAAIIGNFASYAWLDPVRAAMGSGTGIFNDVLSDVRNACNKESETAREEKSEIVGQSTMGEPIIHHYDLVTYQKGREVADWIYSHNRYASGNRADFPSRQVKESAGGGCVLCGTKILTDSEGFVDMRNLICGENVISHKKEPSEFSGEVIYNDHVKYLYSVNEDSPFMSLDHMILTTEGYKCLSPQAALGIDRDVDVSLLKINDVIIRYVVDEQGQIQERYEKVEKINVAQNDKPCVDIHISDGYKSYITQEGYACYVNYPQITSRTISNTLASSRNYFANRDFRRAFAKNKKELADAFGETGVRYMEQMMGREDENTGEMARISYRAPDYLLGSLDLTDVRVSASQNEEPGFSKIHIIRNHLFFDDDMEHPVRLTVRDGSYYWKRNNPADSIQEERGMLRMYDNGFYGEGVVERDGRCSRFCLSTTSRYQMILKRENQTDMDCGTYEMGYIEKDGRFMKYGAWNMEYTDLMGERQQGLAASSEDSEISYSIDESHNLCSHVKFTELAARQFDNLRDSGMRESRLVFDTSFSGISGSAFYQDKDKKEITVGEIVGTLTPQAAGKILEMSGKLADMHMEGNLKQERLSLRETNEIRGLMEMSVLDLYNLSQPENMNDVHTECFNKMIKMAAHAAYQSGDDVSKYMGIARPTVGPTGDITQKQAEIAEKNKEFFVDGLAISYLSYSYSKNTDEKISKPITSLDGYENKIKYYMQGKDEGCMSSDYGYQEASNELYRTVYAANVPGLSDYMEDQEHSDWAKQLYEYCNSPDILNGLILTQMVSPENSRINHLCTMLDVLDCSGRVILEEADKVDCNGDQDKKFSFGSALRKQVTDLTFKYAFKYIKIPDKNDKEAVKNFNETIVGFLQTYFKNLEEEKFQNWTADIYKEATEELQKAAEEAGYESIEDYIGHLSEIVADATEILLSFDSPDMPSRIVEFFEGHPNFSRAICMGFYIAGVTALFFGFKDWSKLTPMERTELITDTVGLGIMAIDDVLSWRACGVFKNVYGDLKNADSILTVMIDEKDFTKILSGSEDIDAALSKLGVDMGELTTEEGDIMAAASKWMNISRIASTVAKVASTLLMAAALGFQIYETVKDFNEGQPASIEAMDIIQDISCGMCFLADAGMGIAALCGAQVCSAIPVVGVIFAVVGLIAAVVMLFLKRKQPPAPIEVFIQERCVPFVQKAAAPPQKWLDDQEKVSGHLNGKNLVLA